MAETSNPNVKVKVTLGCGCARSIYGKYNDPRPVLHTETECQQHGPTEIASYVLVGQ